MGCDIHSVAQVLVNGKWLPFLSPVFEHYSYTKQKGTEPFGLRNYRVFGFLANVRNYSFVPYISEPRGLPPDLESNVYLGDHSHSWLTLRELLEFNYEATFENRRTMRDGNGAADSGIGSGLIVTFIEFLGPNFFTDLATLASLGSPDEVRIVFGFDS